MDFCHQNLKQSNKTTEEDDHKTHWKPCYMTPMVYLVSKKKECLNKLPKFHHLLHVSGVLEYFVILIWLSLLENHDLVKLLYELWAWSGDIVIWWILSNGFPVRCVFVRKNGRNWGGKWMVIYLFKRTDDIDTTNLDMATRTFPDKCRTYGLWIASKNTCTKEIKLRGLIWVIEFIILITEWNEVMKLYQFVYDLEYTFGSWRMADWANDGGFAITRNVV